MVAKMNTNILNIYGLNMTHLSVNINKFAKLRNSRGGNNPDLVQAAVNAQKWGAHGITVHPRPDERHIRYQDVYALKEVITTEFNIEGNPKEQKFVDLVLAIRPHQVTLVPDALNQLTSNHGWDTVTHLTYLQDICATFKNAGIRVSIFLDPDVRMVEYAAQTGAHRIELYTEAYAHHYLTNKEAAIAPYIKAAEYAHQLGLRVNAGHDLDQENLQYFLHKIPTIAEVSIGHALICDALYLGFEETIRRYLKLMI